MIHKLCIQFCFVCETIMDIRHIFLIFCYISDKPTLKWHLKTKPTMIVHFICLSDRASLAKYQTLCCIYICCVYINKHILFITQTNWTRKSKHC